MNLKLILTYLIILWFPMFSIISLFALLNTIQPTLAGFSIMDLMKFSFYIILPIIYIATILLSIFKFKVKFDMQSGLIFLIAGFILNVVTIIQVGNFMVPHLSAVGFEPIGIAPEALSLLKNIPLIQSFGLAYIFSISLLQLTSRKLLKILTFVFGGLLIFYVLGFIINFLIQTI